MSADFATRLLWPCFALTALACGGKSATNAHDDGAAGKSTSVGSGGIASRPGAGGTSTAKAGSTSGGQASAQGGDIGISVGGDSGEGGAAGAPNEPAILAVLPSMGCGTPAPEGTGPFSIATSGTKDPDCAGTSNGGVCGPWAYDREYAILLPKNYDNTHPYMLVFETPGCGGGPMNSPAYEDNAHNTIIRVGLGTSKEVGKFVSYLPNGSCFDAWEGDDSVEFVFYEKLYDLLSTQLCFDRNRVFVGGTLSGGSSLADELGCKYAGDAARPVRGVMPNSGGLLSQPAWKPTCSHHGMAGFWTNQVGNSSQLFTQTEFGINRAMTVNGCPDGLTYGTATFENYPIGGGNPDDVCRRITGCDPLYPLVVCALPGTQHSSNGAVVESGVSTFLQSFLAPPLGH